MEVHPESIHLCDFPEVHENWIDPKMEEDMADLLEIVVMGRRKKHRQYQEPSADRNDVCEERVPASEFYKEIIEDELNVKEVVFKDDIADFISYSLKPQMRTVGPKIRKTPEQDQNRTRPSLDGNKANGRAEEHRRT